MTKIRIGVAVKEAAKEAWQYKANVCWENANSALTEGCILIPGRLGEEALCWLKRAARLNSSQVELSATEKEVAEKIVREALELSRTGRDISCLQKFFEIAREIL